MEILIKMFNIQKKITTNLRKRRINMKVMPLSKSLHDTITIETKRKNTKAKTQVIEHKKNKPRIVLKSKTVQLSYNKFSPTKYTKLSEFQKVEPIIQECESATIKSKKRTPNFSKIAFFKACTTLIGNDDKQSDIKSNASPLNFTKGSPHSEKFFSKLFNPQYTAFNTKPSPLSPEKHSAINFEKSTSTKKDIKHRKSATQKLEPEKDFVLTNNSIELIKIKRKKDKKEKDDCSSKNLKLSQFFDDKNSGK